MAYPSRPGRRRGNTPMVPPTSTHRVALLWRPGNVEVSAVQSWAVCSGSTEIQCTWAEVVFDVRRRLDEDGSARPRRARPPGVRKVGRIAATGEPIEALDLPPDPPAWAADPDWMRAEGIAGFGGQPLVHRGEVLGVLGVFARGAVGPDCMDWLRTIADHAAAAIATARAFERIEELDAAAGAGERVPARGGHAGRRVRRAGRPGPGPGGGRPADRPGGADRRGRPHPRRERHGQGAGRPRGAPAERRDRHGR